MALLGRDALQELSGDSVSYAVTGCTVSLSNVRSPVPRAQAQQGAYRPAHRELGGPQMTFTAKESMAWLEMEKKEPQPPHIHHR